MKKVSICIPVYNEEKNLGVALERVEKVFQNLSHYELEIVVTDNGSTDSSWEKINEYSKTRPNLKGYRFSRNFGYQNSVFAGLSLATGDAVIELDADCEDPPEVIPSFLQKWEEGYDVVYGVRERRFGSLFLRTLFYFFYKFLNSLADQKIPENAGDFRLLDRKVVDVLKQLPERNLYLRGLVVYLGFKQKEIRYQREPREYGVSKFKFIHYCILAVDAITAFTKTPLRMMGVIGAGMFLLSLGLALYYFFSFLLWGTQVQGFATLVVLILGLHSISFMFLGVLGEYMSRIFDDSKNRPRVVLSDSTEKEYPKVL